MQTRTLVCVRIFAFLQRIQGVVQLDPGFQNLGKRVGDSLQVLQETTDIVYLIYGTCNPYPSPILQSLFNVCRLALVTLTLPLSCLSGLLVGGFAPILCRVYLLAVLGLLRAHTHTHSASNSQTWGKPRTKMLPAASRGQRLTQHDFSWLLFCLEFRILEISNLRRRAPRLLRQRDRVYLHRRAARREYRFLMTTWRMRTIVTRLLVPDPGIVPRWEVLRQTPPASQMFHRCLLLLLRRELKNPRLTPKDNRLGVLPRDIELPA